MDKLYIPLAVEPMLLTDKQLAVVLNISTRHLHTLDVTGKIPQARSLNSSKRWSTQEIREWVDSGCPNREAWEQIKRGISNE